MFKADKKIYFALAVFLLSLLLLVSPVLRQKLKNAMVADRQVLSVVHSSAYPLAPFVKVLKVRDQGRIYLEVYAQVEGIERVIERANLGDVHDAFYEVNGRATNLALNDLDGDGIPEVVSPTYDLHWNPKLNVFRFNKENNSLEQY